MPGADLLVVPRWDGVALEGVSVLRRCLVGSVRVPQMNVQEPVLAAAVPAYQLTLTADTSADGVEAAACGSASCSSNASVVVPSVSEPMRRYAEPT